MKLFEDKTRNDSSNRKNNEPIFHYLDRTESTIGEYLRYVLNCWLALFPIEKQNSLLGSLTKKDDEQFKESFSEIFVYKLLYDLKSNISVEPMLIKNSNKNPDFLETSKNQHRAAIEVTTKYHQPKKVRVSQSIFNSLVDGINLKIPPRGFFIAVEIEGILTGDIRSRDIIKKIEDWIEKSQIVREQKQLDYQDSIDNSLMISFPNGQLHFRVYKTDSIFSNVVGSIGTAFLPLTTDIYRLIKDAMDTKIKKYKNIEYPFLLVINLETFFNYPEDIIPCLFPKLYEVPQHGHYFSNSEKRPLFSIGKYSFISAILILKRANPFNLPGMNPTLFMNPYATLPYMGNLNRLSKYEFSNGKVQFYPGLDVLNLMEVNKEIFYK